MNEGIVKVALYDDTGKDFLSRCNREIVRITKKWGTVQNAESCSYHLCGGIDWPYGYCEIGFNGFGSVKIEIDPNNMIPVKEYIINVEKYMDAIL